jgi:tellurite resistance protein
VGWREKLRELRERSSPSHRDDRTSSLNEHGFAEELADLDDLDASRGPSLTFEVTIGRERSTFTVPVERHQRRRRRSGITSSPDECWKPKGTSVHIAGRTIDGLVYVGKDLAPVDDDGWLDLEPALIDPRLKVAPTAQRGAVEHVWPLSYEKLAPGQRATYLDWLASGRTDPQIDARYVELFLAGLERRGIVDAGDSSAAQAEIAVIADEVSRLIDLYGELHRIVYRAESLLHLLRVPLLAEEAAKLEPPKRATGWQAPLELRLGLGAFAKTGQPLPVDWALSWLRCSPEAYLRTPAQRCHDEFESLVRLRYTQRFGEGLKLKPLKQRIVVEHYPLNEGVRRDRFRRVTDLPDVVAAGHLVNALRELGRSCSDELDAYSRFLGRNPDARNDPRALGLLPRELASTHDSPALVELRRLTAAVDADHRVKTVGDKFVTLMNPGAEKLDKKDAAALSRLLVALDLGMEPDVRFGGPALAAGQPLVLFRLLPAAPDAPTPPYAAATALLNVAAAVATADSTVTPEEEQALAMHLARAPGLDEHERVRLAAHLDWLLACPPSLRGLKGRVNQLGTVQREEVAAALVAIAGADGHISPDEVRVLTKVFEALGLEEATLYAQLHSVAVPAPGPVTVRPRQPGDPEFGLPSTLPRGEVLLDQQLVDAKLAESASVSTLLASIFEEDPPPPREHTVPSIGSLSSAEAEFAGRLGERSVWTRADVEALASELGILTDGALEAVNDAAFEVAGAPLWEGDDPVEVDRSTLEELLR